MNLFLYRLLLYLFLPVIALASWNRCRKYRKTLNTKHSLAKLKYCVRGRFGLYPEPFQKHGILIHAVSIGETRSIFPLLSELKKRYPEQPITLTNSSIQGALHAFEFAPIHFQHQMLPYDYPFAVKRFLKQVQPKLVIMVETEIWPNLYQACQENNIPVVLINARLKEKSFKSYKKWGGSAISNALKQASLITAQTDQDAIFLKQLGAIPEQLKVLGNLKSDLNIPQELKDQAIQWRKDNHATDRPIWIAASTHAHDGHTEEATIIEAHKALLKQNPNTLLILVPRHQRRFSEVAEIIEQSGLRWQKRSDRQELRPDCQVYLADSTGEMMLWYEVANITFIGGSLVPFGGHNILEPAALKKPIISGPHFLNLSNMFTPFIEEKAIKIINDQKQLAVELTSLLEDRKYKENLGERAYQCYKKQTGALQKTLDELEELLNK